MKTNLIAMATCNTRTRQCKKSHRLVTIARNDLQGHTSSLISILSDRAYGTSYYWLIVTLVVSLTVSEIWPVFHWKMHNSSNDFRSTSNLKKFPLQ